MRKIYGIILLVGFISCKQRLYRAPTGSMEETIMTGQTFTVTPATKFERNDIVVFNYYGPDYTSPDEETGQYKLHWEKRVYRLIAYSGDSVEIKNGEVFINDNHIQLPPKGKLRYEVYAKGPVEEFDEHDLYGSGTRKSGDTLIYTVDLTAEKAEDYRGRKPYVMGVKRMIPGFPVSDTTFAKASQTGKWTLDNYGPFKIPSPGDKVFVEDNNFKFYGNIPGITKGMNTITEKLYFVLGDNRYAAADSRYIGLVSQSKMYGIVE